MKMGCSTVFRVTTPPFARASWALVGVGCVLAVANSFALSTQVSSALYLIATLQLAPAVFISVRKHRPDRAIWPTLIAIATLSAVAQLLDGSFSTNPELQAIPESLFLGVQVLLAGGLLFIIRRRLGNEPFSVLTDGLIVALGAWFLIWIAFLQPISQLTDQTLLVTVLGAITLGISAIVLFSLATLLFGDEARSPSVWLVAGAIAFTLLGDFMYSAVDSGRADFSQVHASSAYILCLFFASAAFVHPSISTLTAHGPVPQQRPLLGRLIVTTAALTIPVLVLALTDPADNSDRAVRAISIFVLTAAVTARVIHAVRANAQTQRELIFSAETDALTGLPNRPLMLTHVSNALIGAWSESRQPTVLFIDVDRFKNINDSLGHQAGDNVLVAVSQRLRNALPSHCIVGRISGDEFVVLDAQTKNQTDAMLLADRILESFNEPLSLRQGDVFVSASIGVATYHPKITATADDLLRHADTAMYRAKDAGRNCVAVFDESMLERVTQRLAVETALYRALERRELRLVHQPIVDIDLGDVVGFEALMRSHVPAEQLWLEITEGVMIAQPDQALATLTKLCDIGVRIAIDDFGTGYSSLSLLQKFPIHRLKIDKSFVSGVADDQSARSLVRTIIAMGESLGLDMVAEGVESVRQLQTLAELHCAKAQGYLISHPVPPNSISQTVAALDQFGAWSKLRGNGNI
jgi:diguanylate cyclase (GGDEF)-like protein